MLLGYQSGETSAAVFVVNLVCPLPSAFITLLDNPAVMISLLNLQQLISTSPFGLHTERLRPLSLVEEFDVQWPRGLRYNAFAGLRSQ
jgi:hypothetical protein